MSRPAARIRHDEITRMVKAVRACGLTVARVTYDGHKIDVIIGESGERPEPAIDPGNTNEALIREPQL